MTPDTLPTIAEAPTLELVMIPLQQPGQRQSHRWAIYCVNPPTGPAVLWGPYTEPETPDRERKAMAPKIWPRMVYYPRRGSGADFPAWHFVLPFGPQSWGKSDHLRRFAWELARRTGRHVRLSALAGWHPDTASAGPADPEPTRLD